MGERSVEVDDSAESEKVPDVDKPIIVTVTEPQETRYTLRQARMDRDMAQAQLEQAQALFDAAQAKVDEAKEALGA